MDRPPRIEIGHARRHSPEGVELQWTVVEASAELCPRLEVDERFCREGIVLAGRLLDRSATAELWSDSVGRTPESWLRGQAVGSLAFCPTNFGWQEGAYLFARDQMFALPGDSGEAGALWTLAWNEGWRALEGDSGSIRRSRSAVALEMPRLVHHGARVPLRDFLGHPRLLADLRNVFDFADERGPLLPAEFWLLLRKVLPNRLEEALGLLDGEDVRVSTDALSETETQRLRSLIEDAGLPRLRIESGSRPRHLEIRGPLPMARLPVVVLGAKRDGSLVVVAVDGRHDDTPGATLEEAASLLVERGVDVGGLGSAGGDVALVQRTSTGTTLLNRPSTRSPRTGAPISRRVPAVLLLGAGC